MLSNWLFQVGDRNPQLWREVKGRVKWSSVLVAVAVSLVVQLLILGRNWRSFSFAFRPSWWFDVFDMTTSVALLFLLFVGGYLLVMDLVQEERRGTLEFVRLSPEPSHSILLGKLLGVPALLYIAIAATVPLHLWAAGNARLSLLTIGGTYLLATASCGVVYAFAVLHVLSRGAKAQVWYVLPVPCVIYSVLYLLKTYGYFQDQLVKARHVFSTVTFEPSAKFLLVVSFWLVAFALIALTAWWECVKRFRRPHV
ncbi:MAG: hypothetical protein KME45_28745 [Stenomitos rutilans HA7619-LM2]|jgi:hypothetical protein|nr:hypothetical protein [Stenomitos rutilans HA7619-LM2]